MPWPPYSERFFHHQASGNWSWTVPAGRRAVISNVDAICTVAGAPWITLAIGPIFLILVEFPVPNVPHNLVMRAIAYQGEVVQLVINTTGIHTTVSGYLFDDSSGATGPPGDTEFERLRTPTPLPAAAR